MLFFLSKEILHRTKKRKKAKNHHRTGALYSKSALIGSRTLPRTGSLLATNLSSVLVRCTRLADEANVRATKQRLLRLASFVALCPRAWSTAQDRAARVALVEPRQCIISHIPYAVITQRRVQSVAFYECLGRMRNASGWLELAIQQSIMFGLGQE